MRDALKRYILVMFMCMTAFSICIQHVSLSRELDNLNGQAHLTGIYKENSYRKYLQSYSTVPIPELSIDIKGDAFLNGQDIKIINDYQGQDGNSVLTGENGYIEYEIDMPKEGMYVISVLYYPIEGKGTAIEREINNNGKLPFFEARSVVFSRLWEDNGEVRKDAKGNEMRPAQQEAPEWVWADLADGSGYYSESFKFYLHKGRNTLKFISVREPMVIHSLKVYGREELASYSYVQKQYGSLPQNGDGLVQKVQAENTFKKSDPMIYAICDRSSPATEPASTSLIKLNTIGGQRWRMPGQWVEWKIDVPEDGLYKLGFRSRQNIISGSFSSRKLTIDGKVPFKEAENIRFNYSTDWQMKTLGDGKSPYLFYLKEGEHVLRLEAVLGDMTEVLETVEASVLSLNACYRKILMITGPLPDKYRDYDFKKEIPDVLEELERNADTLEAVSQDITNILGSKGENNAVLDRLSIQLREMVKKPETIAERFDAFKQRIGALGTWILTAREQPLEIDYILVAQPQYKMPGAGAGIISKLLHEIKMFIGAFSSDYNAIRGSEGTKDNITVWTVAGRDQAQILRQMIDEEYTPKSGIGVKLQMVAPGTLLPSVLARKGPDVALNIGSADVVNFAARGALSDIVAFKDSKDVLAQFHESAVVPLRFDDGVYGVPETQTFPVLFYRKDILEELGLEVPKTWNDIYDLLPEIQKKHMEFAPGPSMPSVMNAAVTNASAGITSFGVLLYQNEGAFYNGTGTKSALGLEASIQAFRNWTDLYVNFKIPIQYDFPNRFRTGEMPIGVADYHTYNLLSVFAPEIKGLWGFAPVMGTLGEDGRIRSQVPGITSACVLMEAAKNKEASWDFIKWFASEKTQVNYGREQESILGAAARYPTANREALKGLPWRSEEIKVLEEQWNNVKAIPEVPGGYYTPRYIDFAFRKVVLHGEDPRETMLDYVKIINDEIKYKRNEFGLNID